MKPYNIIFNTLQTGQYSSVFIVKLLAIKAVSSCRVQPYLFLHIKVPDTCLHAFNKVAVDCKYKFYHFTIAATPTGPLVYLL